MAIGDDRAHDDKDLTVEHMQRVAKAKEKMATQMRKLQDARKQLLAIATNRNTYFSTPDMWERVLGDARQMLDDVEREVDRQQNRTARGADWEW
jgi:hypothetical protein